MVKKILWIILLALSGLLLSACERSAVAPQAQATPTTGTGGGPTIAINDAYKTQTAAGTVTALVMTMQPGLGGITTPFVGLSTPTATVLGAATLTPSVTPSPTIGGNPGAPTPTPGKPATYTLQEGEFPYCIARRFNIDPDELLLLNGLGDGQIFQPGLTLKIPQTGNPYPGTRSLHPHPATYTVQLNDTIYKIACYFGDVDPIYLAAFNNIVAPYVLQTGRVISVP